MGVNLCSHTASLTLYTSTGAISNCFWSSNGATQITITNVLTIIYTQMKPKTKNSFLTLKPNTCLAPEVGCRVPVIKTQTSDHEKMVIPNIVPYLIQ